MRIERRSAEKQNSVYGEIEQTEELTLHLDSYPAGMLIYQTTSFHQQ